MGLTMALPLLQGATGEPKGYRLWSGESFLAQGLEVRLFDLRRRPGPYTTRHAKARRTFDGQGDPYLSIEVEIKNTSKHPRMALLPNIYSVVSPTQNHYPSYDRTPNPGELDRKEEAKLSPLQGRPYWLSPYALIPAHGA